MDAEASIDLNLTVVRNLGNAKDYLALRFTYPFDERIVRIAWMLSAHAAEALEDLAHCLVEFGLPALRPRTSANIGSNFSSM